MDLFNHVEILKNTPNLDKLSIILKKGDKGVSIFAKKDIAKGDTIAYYKMKIYKNIGKTFTVKNSLEDIENAFKRSVKERLPVQLSNETLQHYKKRLINKINDNDHYILYLHGKRIVPHKNDMYHFTVYNKHGYEYQNLTGDLYSGSLPKPKNNIPYWGYFSNEPSCKQSYNADVDVSNDRLTVKEGDTLTYAIVANKNIKKGEEVLWCYGNGYRRTYPTSCDRKSCKK